MFTLSIGFEKKKIGKRQKLLAVKQIQIQRWSGKNQRIETVKHAAVAGDQIRGVLHTHLALENRLDQISQLTKKRDYQTGQN